jgi:hypothetical protein
VPWTSEFYDPIILPDGRKLVTLKDAATYVTKLPKKEAALPEWQAADQIAYQIVEVIDARGLTDPQRMKACRQSARSRR